MSRAFPTVPRKLFGAQPVPCLAATPPGTPVPGTAGPGVPVDSVPLGPARRPAWVRWLAVLPIRFYQWFISPILPPSCRFSPSCSAYAVEAVLVHGVVSGGWLALRRLLRCHPWCSGGYDPVPPARDPVVPQGVDKE